MLHNTGLDIFGFNPDANNHGTSAHIVHAGFHRYQFPNFYRIQEINRVHRGCHTIIPRKFRSAGKSDLIEQRQDESTMNFAAKIGM
jgi:hypothetical protein